MKIYMLLRVAKKNHFVELINLLVDKFINFPLRISHFERVIFIDKPIEWGASQSQLINSYDDNLLFYKTWEKFSKNDMLGIMEVVSFYIYIVHYFDFKK